MSSNQRTFDRPTGQAANDLQFSDHADQRLHQRGLRPCDLDLILTYGEWVEDGCLLSGRAIHNARRALRHQGERGALQRMDHLRNVTVILEGNTVVTVYRADARRLRRLRAGHVKAA